MNDGQLFNLLRVEIAPNAKSILGFKPIPFEKTVKDTSDYIKSMESS